MKGKNVLPPPLVLFHLSAHKLMWARMQGGLTACSATGQALRYFNTITLTIATNSYIRYQLLLRKISEDAFDSI